MASNSLQDKSLFAPPTQEELDLYAPPPNSNMRELDLFTPPPEEQKLELGAISDSQITDIASRYGVDPEELRSLAPYYGARLMPRSAGEAVESGIKGTAGFVGSAALLNIPQFVYKKLQDEPTRKALDDIQALAREKQNPVEIAREFVVPGVGLPRVVAATTTGRLAGGALLGAAAGAAGSREGEEIQGARAGAAIGGALGVGGELLSRALARRIGATPGEQELIHNRQFDISKGADDIAARTEKSEEAIEDLMFGARQKLSEEDASHISREQLGDDTVQRYLDPSTEEGALLRRQLSEGPSDTQLLNKLADDIAETRVRQFAEDLSGERSESLEDAVDSIRDIASREGQQATRDRYREFVRLKQAEKYISEEGIRAVDQPNFFGRSLNFVSDNQFVLRHMDDRYGTDLEGALSRLNSDYNRSTFALRDLRSKQNDIFQEARKEGTDRNITDSTKIYDSLNSGDTGQLSPSEQKIAGEFRKYFDNIREFVNSKVAEGDHRIAPLNIPYRKNYVPRMLQTVPEMGTLVERKADEAREILSRQLGRDIRDLGQLRAGEFREALSIPQVQDLVRTAQLFDNRKVTDARDLSVRLKELFHSREGNVALETAARAVMERKGGDIPEYLLEKNLYKLADRYTANTIRHLYLRKGIDQLRYQAKAMEKAGADVDAGYVRNLIGDIMGVRKGTAAEAFLQLRVRSMQSLDRAIEQAGGRDTIAGGALTAAKATPDMLLAATRQIYPNMLGYYNIRAVLQNLTSGITKVAPELGTVYGTSSILRGAVYTVANLRRLLQRVEAEGHVPAEFVREGEQAIAEGIRRSQLFEIPAKALEGMSKAGMLLYQWSEKFNRALVRGTSEMVASDLARGNARAMSSLGRFPASVRKKLLDSRNNPEVTSEILSKYLNDVTQYNYNRISMSEFGRTMGPIFSAFSKWPTATVGDIIYEIRSKGLLKSLPRNAEKYILPIVLLQTVDYLMGENSGGLSDREKKLVGSKGLSQSAPVGSLSGFVSGEVFTPPAVDALTQGIILPALEGDTSKLGKGASSLINSFVPGAGLFRLITDDIVTYINGRRPEGSTFIERTREGAREITK